MSRDLPPDAVRRLVDAAAPLADDPDAGALDERYELLSVIGRGGMGVVWEAFDRELGRKVALKVLSARAGLSEEARQRFLREAKAAARLVHPHVATVYDATPEAIAMQRVNGTTLAELGDASPRLLAGLVRDAALAIHYAHGEGVVHRDLKPANLMVEPGQRPHVYVTDFGLAKETRVDSSLSLSGSVVGTPAYMAPEQAAGRTAETGPRTDVYGLGATLWACLAGRPPFQGDDLWRLLGRVVEEEPPPLRSLAPRVDRDLAVVVAKCMEKDPLRRYPTALALASDLDRWLRGEPVLARPASPLYRLRRYVSRRQGAVVAGVGAALLVLLALLPFYLAQSARRATAERVLRLSDRVAAALRDARAARTAGAGRERAHWEILEEAARDCRAFLDDTEVGPAWLMLGELLREQGRWEEAVAALDRAAELSPDLPDLPRARGLALASLHGLGVPVAGEEPPAELERWRARGLADLELALERAGDRPTADRLFLAGQRAWLAGELERAAALCREVVEMDPGHRDAHLALSRLYLLLDRLDLAMRHSVVASDLLRGFGPAYTAAAPSGALPSPERDLLALEGMEALLIDFALLLQADPGEAPALGLAGQVALRDALRAEREGRTDAALAELAVAERELGAALQLDPGCAAAFVNRAACRARAAELRARAGGAAADGLAGAVADYGRALELSPGLAAALHGRALVAERRAELALLALRPERARELRDAARADAEAALERAGIDHPLRARFEAIVIRSRTP